METIVSYGLAFVCAMIALTVHEYCHGYIAYKLGDPTAKSLGRLSLNPLKHLDLIGAICMVLFHFGWAKPVPINPRYFKKPKRDFALVAIAGPLINLILAFLSMGLYLLFLVMYTKGAVEGFSATLTYTSAMFFYYFHLINLGFAIFNLIPIPPLDGSRILNVILPPRMYFSIMKHERKIYLGLIIWLIIGELAVTSLLSFPVISSNSVLSGVVSFLSLQNILDYAISGVSSLMESFYLLFIPLK